MSALSEMIDCCIFLYVSIGNYIVFYLKVISCNKQVCTLQITDTTGSNQFPAMQRLSISKGHAFMMVYSVCNRESFQDLQPIHEELVRIKGAELDLAPIILVGNKSEDESERQVSKEEGEAQATLWKASFMETSAKDNTNVKDVFQELLRMETRQSMTLVGDSSQTSLFLSCFRFFSSCSASTPKSPPATTAPVKMKSVKLDVEAEIK